ncbi:von Willebrand factor type A [Natronococcus amylolyticus DSM 10524]|uniref:von Willebrand factor type A n=1 Tax=Natronococcus amylolyticus DSM 10524 TaxID=1227497 RepID=L9XI47_9EURY|nr:hypothetical protein [Natronococcus amylolyticus]ELY60348.1 von Willebrand factor type A [Natronococcus amylolyticus DSM 10524]
MNTGNDFELSRRKILAGLGGIGIASAGAGLGTTAYLADREDIEDNKLVAGQLDLRIDWQQKYFGPEENKDHYAPYGPAGYPYVNAHPDHDGSGEQSLALNDTAVRYSDNDRNIQEYLTCETLSNFGPGDFNTDKRTQDHLIELEDVKPGDCGEITFSYHLCDNPGYVWFFGELGEIDPALAEAVEVQLWYDLECTNEVDEEDTIIFEGGSLSEVLADLEGGVQLDSTVYDSEGVDIGGDDGGSDAGGGGDNGGSDDDSSNGECVLVGKIDDVKDGVFSGVDGGSAVNNNEFNFNERANRPPPFGGGEYLARDATVRIDITEFKDGNESEPVAFTAEVIDGDYGLCGIDVRGGGDIERFDDLGCTTSTEIVTNLEIRGGQRAAISNIEFFVCDVDDPDPPDPDPPGVPGECFPANETFCIGFEWCLPTDTEIEGIDDVNDLQGKSVVFDLGFYTEQCRHNDEPSGPPGGA